MDDPVDEERLKRLEDRIAAARKAAEPKPRTDHQISQANLAWRMVIELVVGLGIGLGIGYTLDSVFGTRPWLMVLFILLGFAAGVRTMLRTAQEVAKDAEADASANGEGD